ncbi:MAG: ORF6N domain-containing protein [Opitutae bacterium]
MAKPASPLIPVPEIQQRIHVVRGKRVMLDADLARFYGVGTRDLNKAVRRNLERFPDDFSFILTREEFGNLMFQPGTSSSGYGGRRTPARVFTEQGVAMLASVLRSERAVRVSIVIIRAFVALRALLSTHHELAAKLAELERKLEGHDEAITNLFEALRQLLSPTGPDHGRKIGFNR